ncbi:hypothetical protein A3C89_02445 [Candidatus Kaiserbacteria bacterium RIFCSPHIGHO2_02_FULL_50_50]|uniref:Uncharacterized protein n=1 Tax=Candidatus Kaiserbacteria bacterium RIFCSPHIGHO2_02_FULL_50_50 TaxID=1798492 RepID=A0A1F6DE74_9BACT|nr:MAG: hypothetical protein A3C89_02445 [Candidatus Kaiserbacteria bacterium RIFCSPHIGHO2_02_FULL_50_50]OGG88195.1 MAG: hypothetical protein A3G62_00360 [Candidatus Kaiserbacteria bacterium RIFCSPLOWO2_12_FULL_50_10]
MRPRHKTGTLAILFSSFCTTVFILMASIELILPIPIISYGAAFLAVFVVMSYLLVALLVPNRQFSKLHVVLLAVAVLMGISIATPGVMYEAIIPTADGYVELVFGPYAFLLNIYFASVVAATIFTYYRRIREEKNDACCVMLKIFAKSFLVYITGFALALFILPALGINFFTNLVLAFSMTIVIGTFAIMYTQRFMHLHKGDNCSLT